MKQATSKLLLTAALSGMLAVTGCTTATAQNGNTGIVPPHLRQGADRMPMSDAQRQAKMQQRQAMMAQQLGLSSSQQQQMQAIRSAYQGQHQALRQQHMSLRQQINAARSSNASATTLLGLYQQQDALKEQGRQLREQEKARISAILTPEQQVKMREMKGKHGKKHKGGKHGGKPHMQQGMSQDGNWAERR